MPEGEGNQSRPRLVVADDEPGLVELLERIFKRHGYDVATASNGEQALRQSMEQQTEVLLTDMVMPVLNGAQVCERLKSMPGASRTRVVIMSSLPPQSIPVCGADGFISKPFTVKAILDTVSQVLEQADRKERQAV